ncbi:hypothetical protein GCM10009745_79830 [Kribbella yunnanensis]|uniref:PA containing protein n=1 Tax=Kribbella yunnanensis TaxID=190194 RepID=A0ABN2J6I2_9ACTN
MSTPAQEQQRAAVLADTAFRALTAARVSLGEAADTTRDVDNYLRRSEEDIFELPPQANRVREAEEPAPFQRNAQYLAGQVDDRLRAGRRGIDEVRDRLGDGARALKASREALTELSELPVEHDQAAMSRLAYQLDTLDRAVDNFGESINQADRRLVAAREAIDPLLNSSQYVDDRQATAARITNVAESLDTQLMQTRAGLRTLNEGFDDARGDANQAKGESAELAKAFHAAANPTPRADQHPQKAATDAAHKPKESEITSRLRDL